MSNKPITQVLGDGLTSQVSGRGRLCCEEAQLTANEAKAAHDNWMAASRRAHRAEAELARRNEELSEAEGEIAALTIRAERAEAELGEWKQTAANALQERDLSWWGEVRLKSERDELQAKLDAAENQRVEEHAKALYETVQPNTAVAWSDQLRGVKESHIQDVRKMLDAGWTPPNNPV